MVFYRLANPYVNRMEYISIVVTSSVRGQCAVTQNFQNECIHWSVTSTTWPVGNTRRHSVFAPRLPNTQVILLFLAMVYKQTIPRCRSHKRCTGVARRLSSDAPARTELAKRDLLIVVALFWDRRVLLRYGIQFELACVFYKKLNVLKVMKTLA